MTNITFFFLLIPFLALALLAVNFIFASHTPYQEKNSTFECGFHSFLGQNRMQFNISFYIFGLLFLLFDLEILLIYPYPVSAQFNSLYGLIIMLIFFLILTLGFTFELGKNALKIDSRQYDNKSVIYKLNNNLLTSNLFNKPKGKIRDILFGLLSGLLVLVFFSFALKYFIFSFNCVVMCLLSGIISVIAIILKTIIKPCLMNDIKKLNFIVENKYMHIRIILIRFIISLFITYLIINILLYFGINADFFEVYSGVLLCEDFIYQEWLDSVFRIDNVLTDRNGRFLDTLSIAKEYDDKLSNIKKANYELWCNTDTKSPQARFDQAQSSESQDIMQGLLDKQWTSFTKQRGDLRRSCSRVLEKFQSLPDNHDGKKFYVDKINKQMSEIKSLGGDFENKKIRPNP